jgi:hypothetical protein
MAYDEALDENWVNLLEENKGDEKLAVQFNLHPLQSAEKSAAEGRPIFDDVEYVKIMTPGDRNDIIHRPATEADKRRFPKQYAAFKSGHTDHSASGTPLKAWPAVTASQVEELKYFHVHTVEQLANLSDTNAKSIGPIIALRQQARDYIEKAKGNAVEVKLRKELDESHSQVAALQKQMAAMNDKLEQLSRSGAGSRGKAA